ncbi:hypothetical protein K1T71_004220 [Dendrolimus kikuchii]|uniref:Uncharacterized protein n=1 Tax=Dendrolimus kikuchii TaxID=765133 RepID=A0ACC1DAI9_9NEOP|nr:hypothetical protein K1T71_004220 [Dendrolimus kikuchii]
MGIFTKHLELKLNAVEHRTPVQWERPRASVTYSFSPERLWQFWTQHMHVSVVQIKLQRCERLRALQSVDHRYSEYKGVACTRTRPRDLARVLRKEFVGGGSAL